MAPSYRQTLPERDLTKRRQDPERKCERRPHRPRPYNKTGTSLIKETVGNTKKVGHVGGGEEVVGFEVSGGEEGVGG